MDSFSKSCCPCGPCIKLSPIESILQYCFATPKPLKARPGLEGCRIAPLCNLFLLGMPFCGPVLFRVIYSQTRRSYYLFFTICLLLVWCTRMLEESRGECTRMLEESRGRVYPNARGKLPWITGICGKNRHRKPQEQFLAARRPRIWTPATFAAINGERSGLAC